MGRSKQRAAEAAPDAGEGRRVHKRSAPRAGFLEPPTPDLEWRDRAACRDMDPELFFPIGETGPAALQIADAKQVCARCTVVPECLHWALASGQEFGVWGAKSESELRELRGQRQTGAAA